MVYPCFFENGVTWWRPFWIKKMHKGDFWGIFGIRLGGCPCIIPEKISFLQFYSRFSPNALALNRRRGVYGNNLMNITLYNESLDEFMWFLLKIHCFLWCIILPLFSSHYFSQEITLGWDNRFSFPSPPLGQRGPGQFNTKTIQHGPLSANFQWIHVSQINPSEQKYLVYYLVLCPKKYVTIYIKWKGFFHICFIKLSSVYTLVYQNNKSTQSGGGPFCPALCEQIYLAY